MFQYQSQNQRYSIRIISISQKLISLNWELKQIIIIIMQKEISEKYNAFQTIQGNVVWGGALSLAWNDLKKTFLLDQIRFQTEDPHVLQVTRNFNECPFKHNDISDKSVYIKTGFGSDTVKMINQDVKNKFPLATIAQIQFDLSPTDIIAYAYLYKSIVFKIKFDLRQEKEFLFNGSPVKSFYARTDKQKKQILCDQYQNYDNFVVHILDDKEEEELHLLKTTKQMTVDEVIAKVSQLEKKGKSVPLRKEDKFQMPCVDLNCERELSQFKGLRFANSKLNSYVIAVIMQKMKLHIDESGAKVQNLGVIVATKSKAMRKETYDPKYIILDKTFWVVMKESQKHPYFCSQVKNPMQ